MARTEHPALSKLTWMANRPTNRRGRLPTEGTQQIKAVIVSVFAYKLKAQANSRGTYPFADMETSDNNLDQVHNIFVRYPWIRTCGFDK